MYQDTYLEPVCVITTRTFPGWSGTHRLWFCLTNSDLISHIRSEPLLDEVLIVYIITFNLCRNFETLVEFLFKRDWNLRLLSRSVSHVVEDSLLSRWIDRVFFTLRTDYLLEWRAGWVSGYSIDPLVLSDCLRTRWCGALAAFQCLSSSFEMAVSQSLRY